jgi:DNA-binding response OmpR family regulator
MSRKVLWVDEDDRIWATERNILTGLGFQVIPISDATSALSLIRIGKENEIHLIILDVMLLPGEDDVTFSAEATDDEMDTGLVLAQKIYDENVSFGKRILFFSRVTKPHHVAKIKSLATRIGAFYLPKSIDTQGKFFIAWLTEVGFIKDSAQ